MTVSLTISDTLDGAQVADALSGGGTGVDLGAVTNGSYSNFVDAGLNTDKRSLFIRHDATIDPITQGGMFIQTYGTGTGFAYGGADSAANDYATLIALANASGNSKNNIDGLSAGLWGDFNHKVAAISQFNFATNGIGQGGDDTVAKFGDSGTDGIDLASAFTIPSEAAVIDSDQGGGGDATNGWTPTAPVDGELGKNADTAKGDNWHIKLRSYLPASHSTGGIVQVELVVKYSFTA